MQPFPACLFRSERQFAVLWRCPQAIGIDDFLELDVPEDLTNADTLLRIARLEFTHA